MRDRIPGARLPTFEADHSASLVLKIALTFFYNTSNASVVANARSLRRNLRSSSLICRQSCLVCSELGRTSPGSAAPERRVELAGGIAARTSGARDTRRSSWPPPGRRGSARHQTAPPPSRPDATGLAHRLTAPAFRRVHADANITRDVAEHRAPRPY